MRRTLQLNNDPWIAATAACFIGLVLLIGCRPSPSSKPQHPAARKEAHAGADPDASADIYQVPSGNIARLEAFIDRLKAYHPTDTMDMLAYEKKAPKALRAAARRILAQKPDATSTAYKKAHEILLEERVQGFAAQSAKDRRATYQELLRFLQTKKQAGQPLTPEYFSWALMVVNTLDTEDPDLAIAAYQKFGALFQGNSDAEVDQMANLLLGAARRLQLPGTPMALQGTRVDGQPFDLKQLRGKVVLIDFWATWCGPCVAEHDHMKSLYQKYHDRGFEIVGISLDVDREKLDNYLKRESIPWITLNEPGGRQNPAYREYGVLAIPVMILVGRDGKVLSIEARGKQLDQLLARQFSKSIGESK